MTIGIYGIRQDGLIVYVGQSINIENRYRQHIYNLRTNQHSSPYFQNAYNKYGIKPFDYIILEITTKEQLTNREQYYMDMYKPKYNYAPVAGSRLGSKQTPEAIEKVRKVHLGRKNTEETKDKMRKAALGNKRNLGRKLTEETKAKMRETLAAKKAAGVKRKRKPMSEETKRKISEAQRGKPREYAKNPRSAETKRKISESQKGKPRLYARKNKD